MASRFVLTAQVQLQAPTNTRQVVNQIQRQLSGVNMQVKLQGGQQAAKQVNNLNKATKQATTQANKMGKAFGASIRRFGAFTIATRAVSLFSNSLANATKEAIDFEREMIKISQVTGKTVAQLKGLEGTITDLATSLGVSSKSILSVGRILSQAGIQAKDLEVALRTLAKTELAPTFDDITQTAEGAVAILAQFGEGVGALERQLGAINRVAGQFAVESGDLISVIRRTGGVFKAAGGDLNELIALFTSVRSTTRESAESIATGLRTIFTRIQRPKTIEFLKEFGVQLTDLNGKFVGPFEAIRQLSGALSGLEQGDIQFVRIAEELGGFRQIGKVIPLLQQFETAEKARQAALEGGNSLNDDAAKAQAALAVQIAKVKEEFLALIRSITQTGSFQTFVKTSLELASALIKVADALKPLIPLLATFGAIKFARGAAGFARGIGAGLKGAGSPTGFARGGMVPGSGNRDTVPAMLTPGEFVIRKSSVSKLGAGTLAAMNQNGYATGGIVALKPYDEGPPNPSTTSGSFSFADVVSKLPGKSLPDASATLSEAFSKGRLTNSLLAQFVTPKGGISKKKISVDVHGAAIGDAAVGSETERLIRDDFRKSVNSRGGAIGRFFGLKPSKVISDGDLDNLGISGVIGNAFEAILGSFGVPFDKASDAKEGNEAAFDFPSGIGSTMASKLKASALANSPTDAKRTLTSTYLREVYTKKYPNLLADELKKLKLISVDDSIDKNKEKISQAYEKSSSGVTMGDKTVSRILGVSEAQVKKFRRAGRFGVLRNSGGGISGSDTVPAMLTPGEFVFNKKAAQSIGYSNLNRMNKQGVQGFAKGGAVQYFNQGTTGSGVNLQNASTASPSSIFQELKSASKEQTKATVDLIKSQTKQMKIDDAILKFEKEANKSRKSLIKKFGETRVGGALKRGANSITGNVGQSLLFAGGSIAAMIPQVEGATQGFGAVQNVLGEVALTSSTLIGLGAQAGPAGVAVAGFASVLFGGIKILDAYNGVHLKATQAIEDASENTDAASLETAKQQAVASSSTKAMNKALIGASVAAVAAGAAFGPVGIAVAGVGSLLGVLGVKLGLFETLFGASAEQVQNFFAILGQGPSVNQVKAQTELTIQSARSQKILAEASKDAAKELKKINSGELSATASLGAGGAAAKAAQAIGSQNQAAAAVQRANQQVNDAFDKIQEGLGSATGVISGPVGQLMSGAFGFLTGGQRTANAQQNQQLRKEAIARGEQFLSGQSGRLSLATREQVTAAAAGGGTVSFEDFKKTLDPSIIAIAQNTDRMNGNTAQMDKLKQSFENQRKATIANIKFIKALNFGLSDTIAGIDAYGASLNNLVASQETGFSTAAVAATTLSTAISSAGKNISSAELGQSLDLLESNLQKFGANTKQISGARELITGLNNVQKGAADALAAVKDGFAGGSTDPKAIQGQLRDAILGSIPDSSPIKQKLIDSFGNLELPPEAIENFLNTGDVSAILDKAFGPIQEQVQKQLIGPLNKLAEQEKVLIGLTQQRREAEQKLISVQKQAIETQIDAAKSLEFFGGPKFTPEREFAARRQQANLTLRDAGVAGLTTGSAADIRRASQDIGSRFSAQQAAQNAAAIRGGGAFGGVAGIDADRRPELKEANKELIQITKQGIAQRKQELELIQKKNQAEKSALDSLLGGDVESFFDQAIGAAAGSALRTGDAAAASLFGAGALGKGLQGLQGTGLSDAENRRASELAFGAFGLGDRAASVFSGTTTEEERIKAEGRELSRLQGELADQSTALEEMNVTATTVVINAANLKMQEISDQVTRAQNIAGFNRGGTVYANRGMFIPRGTDTVPAMLTPGEFVVNRAAVARGNNLQILRAMNSNSAPIQAAQGFSGGGAVRYRAGGSTGPEPGGGMDFSKFEELVNKFQEVTDKLGNVNIKHMFDKLGTLDINHMFNGNMQQAFKDEILAEAGNMMSRSKFNSDGSITTSDRSVLG